MLERILVATDFSTRSDRALRRGILLARQASALLVVAHIVDDDQPHRLVHVERRESAALLQDLAQTLRESDGLECESRVALGDAFQGIVQVAEEVDADLLILGPHRRQVLRDFFFGTTAERTVRTSRRPVLMANGVPVTSYRTVLIATDLSDCSFAAAYVAKGLGLFAGAAVIALHVADLTEGPIVQAAMTTKEFEDRNAAADVQAMIELKAFTRKLGIVASHRVLKPSEESTAMAINSYANAEKADLIVTGTHGRSGFEKWLLGSVAERILGSAEVDVLAVGQSEYDQGPSARE
jgi:nucleotide-binding universal stress UspA family protein